LLEIQALVSADMVHRHTTFGYIGLALAALGLGCSGEQNAASQDPRAVSPPANTAGETSSCAPAAASIQTTIFKPSCDGAGCHGSQNPAAGLNLMDTAPDQLLGISASLCSGWSLIVPGSPEKSFLYQKLAATRPTCGEPMPLGQRLPAASTQCIADWISGLAATGGCETCGGTECVALASDANHCGRCDNACPAGVACENGKCSCAGGALSCGGTCVDATSDALNCGACGNACGPASSCVAGKCSCSFGLESCGATCADLGSDAQHCGSCAVVCGAGEVCLKGQCAAGCGSLTQCGTSCIDTQTNPLNCGGCGKTCAPGQTCEAGKCGCSAGAALCGSGCVDLASDPENCGACGKTCGAGEACVAGSCSCRASTTVSFKNDVAPALAAGCTAAGCHAGMKPKEGLSLDATKSYAELVNVTSSQCGGGRKLVVPGAPSSSYLLQKLLDIDVCSGTQMPKAGQTLPQSQIDAISSWICSGAPNN
jgi:hypothetical protein